MNQVSRHHSAWLGVGIAEFAGLENDGLKNDGVEQEETYTAHDEVNAN